MDKKNKMALSRICFKIWYFVYWIELKFSCLHWWLLLVVESNSISILSIIIVVHAQENNLASSIVGRTLFSRKWRPGLLPSSLFG